MLSISRNVCVSVCVSACSLLKYRLNVFLPPLPEVGCPKSPRKKKLVFLLILAYKICWKPRFPVNERPPVEGYIANFGISLDVFEFLRFGWFFFRFKKNWVFGYSWSTLPWYWCYFPHRSRDALSPVNGIFFFYIKETWGQLEKVASRHQLLLRIMSKIRNGFWVYGEYNRFGLEQSISPIVKICL